MSKRVLSLFFVLMLLVGGAAACGDDGGDDGGDGGGSSSESDGGDGGGGGGNADVQAYCDDVDALASAIEEADGDPTAIGDLTGELQALQESGTELAANAADLDTEDSEALTECTTRLSDAAAGLAP